MINPNNDDDNAPHYADLSDYILFNHPLLFDASKYLEPSAQYQIHLKQWEIDGRPEIKEVY